MVSSPQGWVLQFNPAYSVGEMLKEAVSHLCLEDLDLGEVISFETVSTSPELFLSSVSKPNRGAEVRPSAIAGAFYPADEKKMNAELDRMLADD
jgi:hypothetical protein